MKDKLIGAIQKLNNIIILSSNAYIFYNIYLIKKVYFRCGIMKITPKQEEILIRISKPVILVKLGLSEKFLRIILYARKTALGIGIMKPSTIIAILVIKLYLGHKRADNRIA